jgi:hypothetical protein
MSLNLEPEEVNANAEFIFGCIIWAFAAYGFFDAVYRAWRAIFA